jgi:hypothetical protein
MESSLEGIRKLDPGLRPDDDENSELMRLAAFRSVIPAQAGIQPSPRYKLDPGVRRDDGEGC